MSSLRAWLRRAQRPEDRDLRSGWSKEWLCSSQIHIGQPKRPNPQPEPSRGRFDQGRVNESSFGNHGKGLVNGGSILTQTWLISVEFNQ